MKMSSFSVASPSSSLTDTRAVLIRRRAQSIFAPPINLRNRRFLRLSASLAEKNLHLSWFSPDDQNPFDTYGGWSVFQAHPPQNNNNNKYNYNKKKGLSTTILIAGIGSSLAVLLAALAYVSFSRKGYRFQFGSPLHGMSNWTETKSDKSRTRDSNNVVDVVVPKDAPGCISDATKETFTSGSKDNLERVIISVGVDSTQKEALSVLKKLKIIEDDVRADKLCTREEYARWLVRINSLLERSPKHKIVPSKLLNGHVIAAFDDVGFDDPNFESIQALAEAGIIPSKLSGKNSSSDGLEGEGGVYFFPKSFISRQDLINWKAQVEYELKPGIIEQISRTKVDYMDVREIRSDASPELVMDMLAGDKSILRKVFGQIKRFQPNAPSTKAQAAVTLTTGRMAEAIHSELLRLEAEKISRMAVMKEIRSELVDRGDIQRFWYEKLNEERILGLAVDEHYHAAVSDLEREKIVQEKTFAEHLREKAAMDCQRQLILSLRDEVDEMLERLATERAMYVDEQRRTQNMLSNLKSKHEGMIDTKSVLEAEKEALRILRSWVEDEARRSQARSKVLEEVGRRWRWDDNQS
ncbi:hypothetical protein CFOL_v3_20950 [Cephalotus follicularis]|uniref:SLH domain-containing protein n=1 Tax=Cephalotus follicularis TaxID=3775 RepID=A0A1Q3CB66_CEPFO|nr:hypothetical protein CFOL_v3_20950 [Cephalotus follicularis]